MFKIQVNVGKLPNFIWKDLMYGVGTYNTLEAALEAKETIYLGAPSDLVRVVEDVTFYPPPPREPVYDENEPLDDDEEEEEEEDEDLTDWNGWHPYEDVYVEDDYEGVEDYA